MLFRQTLSLAFFVLLLALAPGHAFAAAPAFAYTVDLQVPPAQRALLDPYLDLYRWQDNERMDQAQLQRLVEQAPAQVREFLSTQGFYAPQVSATLEQRDGQWVVLLVVEPGEAVRVGSVGLKIEGLLDDGSPAAAARLQALQEGWTLPVGAPFRHPDWESAKRASLKALLLDGYPAAHLLHSAATVDLQAQTVALDVTLDSGPAFTFGPLDIQGLQRYPPSLVERLSTIVPGEPYSQTRLLDLQSSLQDSPYFSSVTASVDVDPTQPQHVPVHVTLVENPARKVGLGAGISTDTGVRGLLNYRDLNFWERAWRLSGEMKLETQRQSLAAELQLPLNAQGYRDSVSAAMERSDIEGEVVTKLVLGGSRSRVRGKNEITYGVRYYLEQQEVAGTQTTQRKALIPSYSWTHRDLDQLLYPTQGYLLNLKADFASKQVVSDQDFLRGYARAVYFYPLGKRDHVQLRGELGVVVAESSDGIPSDFLFRTGGDQTVRGYAYQSLGVAQGGAIVGGRWLTVASAEYVHWFAPQWGAAAFVDVGSAADRYADLRPVRGYGLGARWKSPVGPLNVDIAYGEATRAMRLHLSVGFTF